MSQGGLRVYEVEMISKSPMIIAEKVGYRGFMYTTLRKVITPTTIRGAVLTAGIREGAVRYSDAKEEVKSHKHAVTPMVYLGSKKGRLYVDVMLSHALTFRFKCSNDRRVFSHGIERLLSKIKATAPLERGKIDLLHHVSELLRESFTYIRGRERRKECENPEESVPAAGEVIRREGRFWVVVESPEVTSHISIEIMRDFGSVKPGALYSYELVKPGSRYGGYISCLENSVLCQVINKLGPEIVARVGKGVSRGFGKAILRFREVTGEEPEPPGLEGGNLSPGEVVALAFLSPVARIGLNVKPPSVGDFLGFSTPLIEAAYGTTSPSFRVLGILSAGLFHHRGWSYSMNSPKLPLTALKWGSIILAEVRRSLPSSKSKLLPYVGVDQLSMHGLNLLVPLKKDFIPEFEVE